METGELSRCEALKIGASLLPAERETLEKLAMWESHLHVMFAITALASSTK